MITKHQVEPIGDGAGFANVGLEIERLSGTDIEIGGYRVMWLLFRCAGVTLLVIAAVAWMVAR